MVNKCFYKECVGIRTSNITHHTSHVTQHTRYDGVHIADKNLFRQRVIALWLSDVTGKVSQHTVMFVFTMWSRD